MGSAPPLRIWPLVVSRFSLDGGAMFGVIPRPLWSKAHPPDDLGRISLVSRVLVIKNEKSGRIALVDTGMGSDWSTRDQGRYNLDTKATPTLDNALLAVGVQTKEVTDVFLSHLHFDHAGGTVCLTRNGDHSPLFPHARYHVQKTQWEWACRPSARDSGSFVQRHLKTLDDHGVLEINNNGPLYTDFAIEMRVVGGHTPGLQIPIIRGEHHTVVFPSDLIPTHAHGQLPWIMAYDLFPLETLRDKEQLLEDAFHGKWILVLEHDPSIGAAQAIQKSGKLILEPCVCPDAI